MKRLPKMRHHKASGQAAVVINGDWHYLGKFGSDVAQTHYDRLLAGLEKNQSEAAANLAYSWTINQLCLEYLKFAKTYYVKAGEITGEYDCVWAALRYASRLFGSEPVVSFGPKKLKVVREAMVRGQFSKRPLARSYVNSSIRRIVRAFRWAVGEEQCPAETLHQLQAVDGLKFGRGPVREARPKDCVPEADFWATVEAVVEPQVADMMRLQWLTGMRPGELCIISRDQIDRSGPVWKYTPHRHKNQHKAKLRLVAIGPEAQKILSKYLFLTRCFTNSRGNPYCNRTYREAVTRAVKRAGVAHWSPNQLRHNALTRAMEHCGLESARAVGSHSQVNTTRIYAGRDFQTAATVAAKIG